MTGNSAGGNNVPGASVYRMPEPEIVRTRALQVRQAGAATPCLLALVCQASDDGRMIRAPVADALCLTVLLTVVLSGVVLMLQR
jgi:hypothetical protein